MASRTATYIQPRRERSSGTTSATSSAYDFSGSWSHGRPHSRWLPPSLLKVGGT